MQIRVGVVDVDISLPGRQQFRFPLNMLDSIQLRITAATPKLLQITGWKMRARTCMCRHEEASQSAHTG